MNALKCLTLNLRGIANRWQDRFPLIAQLLHEHAPHIIALQESRLKINQAQTVANALADINPDMTYSIHQSPDWYEPNVMSNVILSAVPVLSHGRIELNIGYRTAHRIRINWQGQEMNIANTHLHHKPYQDEHIRLKQMKHTLAWLQAQNIPYILMGDFNARPESETIQFAKQYTQSAYETIHRQEPDFTFPTPLREENFQPRTIDYIFTQQGAFEVVNAQLVGNTPHENDPTLYASDHFGLVAELVVI